MKYSKVRTMKVVEMETVDLGNHEYVKLERVTGEKKFVFCVL